MTVTTTARPGTARAEHDWLYYRIFVEEYEDLRPLVDHTVRRVVAVARDIDPDSRWFFLRFVDERGMHVRLRHHGRLDSIAALEAVADRILADPGRMPPELARSYRGFAKGLYEPERAKFGGPAGVLLAQRASRASSELALELSGPDEQGLRLGHGLATMLIALELLPEAQHASFLYNMTWYWTGRDGERARAARARVAAAARRVAPGLRHRLACVQDGPHAPALAEYRHSLRRALAGYRAAAIPLTAPYLLFHLVHLTNNRLGIKPSEEAVLARWLQYER
ncbi:thiopeptide-type bacteriocin biosynthesis protein [Streptomyces sp. NPDC087218]|uniref:thiopeptide-type bacteriocin biosynthesis protein n=1 Tax=Streptomyces sp. NPDC087218 TaxID=3365769 RepID=UPI003804CBC5